MEVLLAKDASEAQEWIVENDVLLDEVEPDEAMGDEEFLQNRRSSRLRELDEEEFVSEDEEELNEDVEYESDEVNINEQIGATLEEED